jgi:hypothetical protein
MNLNSILIFDTQHIKYLFEIKNELTKIVLEFKTFAMISQKHKLKEINKFNYLNYILTLTSKA